MPEVVLDAANAFDRWCYAAQSEIMMDGKPLPLLTELLHRVCDGDEKKFANAVEIMRAAFDAGAKSSS